LKTTKSNPLRYGKYTIPLLNNQK